jgi:hypothetical protein
MPPVLELTRIHRKYKSQAHEGGAKNFAKGDTCHVLNCEQLVSKDAFIHSSKELVPMKRTLLWSGILVFAASCFARKNEVDTQKNKVDMVQPTDAGPTCPGLKIEIRVPDDIVRPQSNVLIEMKLTNVAHEAVWLPAGSPDFWSYEFELRDAQGTLVPRTAEWVRALAQRSQVVLVSASMPLAAGASLIKTVMLEKLFDLSKPGKYTLRVSFASFVCDNSGTRVTSNLIHFKLDPPSNRPSTSQARISIMASAMRARLPVGWGAPLDIVVQNNSGHQLRWAVDAPPNTAPDEFLTGVEVFNAAGEVCPPPKRPDPNWSFSRFRGAVSIIEIPPGKSAEQIILLGDLFDIGKPGRYRAKVALLDPESNRQIESNLVSFEIEDTTSSRPLRKQPPFLVTLQPAHFAPPDPSNVLICMSNISDHDIRLDNSSGKDFASVEGPDGNPATLTEAAQRARKLVDLAPVPAGLEQCCTWSTVKPRMALCGGLTIGAIYNLSKAGAYRIRIDRYDEPDAMPGQKLSDLPMVHSNWLTIFENPPAASEK